MKLFPFHSGPLIQASGFVTTRLVKMPRAQIITMASWLMKILARTERIQKGRTRSMKKGGARMLW